MVTLGNTRVHLLTSDIPELCRRKEFSHLGQTPVLHVKCLHQRYIGIYFSMSNEYSVMGFLFFQMSKYRVAHVYKPASL